MCRVRINALGKKELDCAACSSRDFTNNIMKIQIKNGDYSPSYFEEERNLFTCVKCGWEAIFHKKYDSSLNGDNITIIDE